MPNGEKYLLCQLCVLIRFQLRKMAEQRKFIFISVNLRKMCWPHFQQTSIICLSLKEKILINLCMMLNVLIIMTVVLIKGGVFSGQFMKVCLSISACQFYYLEKEKRK
ncbi:hypothetical protein EGW08_004358 [Elysia chlorotica]|uniref:Uncharacterized protein n=1 Tax=Elysia chlorotica TaxID=188477 RepID=A0A433U256_ELYCH|nr:hypothetical protein EGW08_004358 [Elysia chlorotica]